MVLTVLTSVSVYADKLHEAIIANDTAAVSRLLASAPEQINQRDAAGMTPLHYSAKLKKETLTQLLIKNGADPRLDVVPGKDLRFPSPLQMAVNANSVNNVAVLAFTAEDCYATLPSNPRHILAHATIKTGEVDKAYDLFTDLFRRAPGRQDINFALGLTAYYTKRYPFASLAYERILSANPDHHRARLELARCMMATEQFARARQEFLAVLASNPPTHESQNILALLKSIRHQRRDRRLFSRIELGFMDDDNVNVGPNSGVISIAPVVFGSSILNELTINEESQPIAARGEYIAASFNTTHDPGTPGYWTMMGGLNLYQSWLDDDAEAQEMRFYGIGGGFRHADAHHVLSIPLRYEHIVQGGNALIDVLGVSPSLLYAAGGSGEWHLLTSGSVESRLYVDLEDRDSTYVSLAGTMHRYIEGKHRISMGMSWFMEDSDSGVYSNQGMELILEGDAEIVSRLHAYTRLKNRQANYKEREALSPEDREDDETQVTAGFHYGLSRHWGLDANFQRTLHSSTFSLYDYDRDIITVRTTCTF